MRSLALALLTVLFAAPARPQGWEKIDASPKWGAAAYDPDRARLVHLSYDGTTLEWEGARWFRRPGATAPFLIGRQMVHDPVRHRMLALVDTAAGASLLAYDGDAWVALQLPTAAGSFVALAYDPARDRVVLVSDAGETFEHDGNTWTRTVASGSPLPQSMVFCPLTQRVMCIAASPGLPSSEVGSYDGVTWAVTTTGTPSLRDDGQLGFDPIANVLVLHGGSYGRGLDDWQFDGTSWLRLFGTRTTETWPSLCTSPSGLFSIDRYSRAGVRLRSGIAWQRVGEPQRPTVVQQLTADPLHGRVYAVGDLFPQQLWQLAERSWKPSDGAPMPAIENLLIEPNSGTLIGLDTHAGLLHLRNDGIWRQWPVVGSAPPARWVTNAAFDHDRRQIVLFGGLDLTGSPINDLYTFDGRQWTAQWVPAALTPRFRAGIVYDPVRRRTLITAGPPANDDTWAWDGTSLTAVSPAHAPFAGNTALVFDPAIGQPVAVNVVAADTIGVYAHDGSNWNVRSLLPAGAALPNNADISAAIQPGTGRLLVSFDDVLRLSPTMAAVSTQATGCGGPLRLTARALARTDEPDAGFDLQGQPGLALVATSLQSANVSLGGNCALLLGSFDLVQTLTAGPLGFASLAVPVPPSPWLVGITVFAQAAQLDPASPQGLALSARLALTIGD